MLIDFIFYFFLIMRQISSRHALLRGDVRSADPCWREDGGKMSLTNWRRMEAVFPVVFVLGLLASTGKTRVHAPTHKPLGHGSVFICVLVTITTTTTTGLSLLRWLFYCSGSESIAASPFSSLIVSYRLIWCAASMWRWICELIDHS